MKNVFVALSLVLLANGAFASEDVRLMFQNRPNGLIAGGKTSQVVVLSNGVVEARVLQAVQNPPAPREIARLSAEEMDNLNRLIDRAADAGTIHYPNRAYCIVAPMDVDEYLADNGKITLRAGHMCLGWTLNESRAAFHLIRKLDQLRQLAGGSLSYLD